MKVYGEHEENTVQQFSEVMETAVDGALMADGHFGYVMPVGGVALYENQVSLIGVGYDIGCGNKAIKLDLKSSAIKPRLPYMMDYIFKTISFGVGRANNERVEHELLDDENLWYAYEDKWLRDNLRKLAYDQLGTVGSGNHFVDIFEDEEENVWVGVHFGSRGLGHKTASGFLNLFINGDWEKRAPEQESLLDLGTDLGQRYFLAMTLSGQYASAGRDWVCKKVAGIIGGDIIDEVHNHHNFAWKENHNGKDYIVVRKGATPAFPGQRGFIGGSMGDNSVIIEGVDGSESSSIFYSTVHGAGRVMGRREAGGSRRWRRNPETGIRELITVREGKISKSMMNEWLKKKNVILKGGGTDESPHCYRRLNEVLEHHKNTIRVLHTLTPLGVMMAGENEFDPYKD